MGKTYLSDNKEIYLFEYRSLYFAFDVHTLTLYSLSAEEYQSINQYDFTKSQDRCSNDVVNALFFKSKKGGQNVAKNDKDGISGPIPVRAIAIEVSNDCNLRCTYCYGDGGSYGGTRELMRTETAYKCVDFLIEHSLGEKNLQIIFFGGEPMMNFETIKAVVEYADMKSKELEINFSFGITTNATLLNDERIEFLKKYQIVTTISIDGPEEVHDANRYYVRGVGSHGRVMEQVRKMIDKKIRLRARATISGSDTRLSYIDEYLDGQGFDDIALTFVDIDENSHLYIHENQFPELLKEIEKLGDKCINDLLNKGTTKIHMFKVPLERLYTHLPAHRGCGAGVTYLAFTPRGDLYPCHRFSNWKEYYLGNYESVEFDNSDFRKCFVEHREKCSDCFCRHLCGGNCIHTAALFNSSIFKTDAHYCSLYKKIFEVSMYIYYVVNEKRPDLFPALFSYIEK